MDTAGGFDQEAFATFAADVTAAGDVDQLSLVEATPGDGRTDYRVVAVQPPSGPAGLHEGDDVSRDPVRASALRRAVSSGTPALTSAVEVLGSTRGVELYRPLVDHQRSDEPVRGVVVAGIPFNGLADTVRGAVGPGTAVTVLDGDALLFGPTVDDGATATVTHATVAGRSWTVVVERGARPSLAIAWLVAAVGAVALLAMGALDLTTQRHQRRLAATNALLLASEGRSRAVQDVAGRLARALSAGEIVAALVEHLPAAVGARSTVIATTDRAGQLELLGPDDTDHPSTPNLGFTAEEVAASIAGTVLTGERPVWLSSPFEWRGDPVLDALAGGGQALALLPLEAEGVAGVLAVSYPKVKIFADHEQDLLRTVSLLAAHALARGRKYDTEHQTSIAFQHSALPDVLPEVDGLTIAARYRPATLRATVGGDWYDAVVLDDDRVVFVVGDVVGHGIDAAAAMGRLRTAFRTIASLTTDPGQMLQAMSRQVESIPNSFCTTVVGVVIDVRAATMTWCRAGHPPPLIVGPTGATELFPDPGLPPLGVAPEQAPTVHCRTLSPGEMVVLYTDGVVERRDESIDEGLQRLGIVAETLADLGPEEFSDALLEALVPVAEQADDLALLVIRVDRVG